VTTDPTPRDRVAEVLVRCGRTEHNALLAAGLVRDEAEVKALVEVATKLGYELGRKEAAGEIADKCLRRAQLAERVPEGERSGVREGMVVAWLAAQTLAEGIASPAQEPHSEPLTASTGHSDLPEPAKGPRVLHKPFPDDGVTYCGWATGSQIVDGCGEVWPCSAIRAQGLPGDGEWARS
jgi:hypothetical protein